MKCGPNMVKLDYYVQLTEMAILPTPSSWNYSRSRWDGVYLLWWWLCWWKSMMRYVGCVAIKVMNSIHAVALLLLLLVIRTVTVPSVYAVQLKLNENFLCDINENALYCDSVQYQFMPFFVERKFAHYRIDKLWLRCIGSLGSNSGMSRSRHPNESVSSWSLANFVRENRKLAVVDYNSYNIKRDLHELHIIECPIEEQPLSQLVDILSSYNDQLRLKVLNVSGSKDYTSASSSIEQLDHFLRKNEAIVRNLHVLEVANVQHIVEMSSSGGGTAIELVHLKHLRKLKMINVADESKVNSKPTRTSVSTSINTGIAVSGPKELSSSGGDINLVRLNSNLLELVLRNNSFMKSYAVMSACSTLLRNLSNLEQLDLSHNALSADQVQNCFQLDADDRNNDIIADAAATGNGGISSSDRGHVKGIAGSDNTIASRQQHWKRFDKLRVLHLAYNRINFGSHKQLFGGGENTLGHLEVLSLDHNDINELTEITFVGLVNLVVLSLTGNKLTVLGDHAFRPLVALRQIDLDANRLTHLATLFAPGKLQNQLQDLNLNGNYLTELPIGLENALVRLKSLDLGSNRISIINGKRFFGLTDLLGLRLVDNLLTRITKNAFYLLTSLQIINLSANRISSIEIDSFQFNQQLQIVRLDQNQLSMLPKNCFKVLTSLLWLNLSNNALNKFYMNELPNSVELLDLHSNKIYEIKNMKGPDYLDHLRYLNLAHNHLPLLNEETIPNGLVEVNVEDNFITFIEINTFANKNRLTRINLRNNLLTRLESKLFFHKINQNHEMELLLAKNPFDCDCSLEWLVILQENVNRPQNLQIVDLDEITCTSPIQRRRLMKVIDGTGTLDTGREQSEHERRQDRLHAEPINSSELKANIRKLIDQSSTRIVDEHQQFLCKYESHCFTLCQCCEYESTCDCFMKCPADCNCYYETSWQTNIVDCGQSNRTATPTRIPIDATVLYLDGNDFHQRVIMDDGGSSSGGVANGEGHEANNYATHHPRSSTNHLFLGRNKLAVLYLNHSQIITLTNLSFYGLVHLKELHLEHNRIVSLEGNEFEHVPKLDRLYLHDNRIGHIDTDTFRALPRLQVLTLRRNAFHRQEPFKFLVPSPLLLFIIDGVLADLHVGNEFNCEFDCNEMEEAFQLDEIDSAGSQMGDGGGGTTKLMEHGGDVTAAAVGLPLGGRPSVTKHFLLQKFFKSKRANALRCSRGDGSHKAGFAIRSFIEHCEFIKEANQQLRLVNKSAAQGAQNAAFQKYLRQHYLLPGSEYLPMVAVSGTMIIFVSFCLILISVFRQQIQLLVFTSCGVRLRWKRARSSGGGVQLTMRRQSNGRLDLEPLCDAWVLCNERDFAYIENYVVDVMDQMGYYMQITSDWEQLARSVEVAQRTMLVISSGFLQIEWQNVAFRQALYSMLGKIESRGSIWNRLIVVVAVPTELLIADSQLLKLIKSATMVQLGEKRFWDKVRFAMPDVVMPIVRSPVSTGGGVEGGRAPIEIGIHGSGGGVVSNEANRNNWRRKLNRHTNDNAGNEPERHAAQQILGERSPDGASNEYDVLPVVNLKAVGSSSETVRSVSTRGSCNENGIDDEVDVDRGGSSGGDTGGQLAATMENLNLHNQKIQFPGMRNNRETPTNGIDNEHQHTHQQKLQLTTTTVGSRYGGHHQQRPHYHPAAGSNSETSSQQAYFV